VNSEASDRQKSSRGRIYTVVAAGVLVVAAVVIAVMVLVSRGGASELEPGQPEEASVQDLRTFAASNDGPVYSAGGLTGRTLELTKTSRNETFVRYLGGGARPGDPRPIFTTIATYPRQRSYQDAARAAKLKGAKSRPSPGGGLAVWRESRPTSVYLAYPGEEVLVEVFDPSPRRAQELALSGEVGPVR